MNNRSSMLARTITLITLTATAIPSVALAGGFSLNEQSASAMGTANAGTAANPENATTALFNPAGMSQLSGTNISFGAAVLDIDAEARQSSVSAVRRNPAVPVQPATGGGDIADPAVLPNFYLTHEVSDRVDVGFGIHAPYGLAADYEDDFAGRFFADKTELTAIAFTPSISVNNGNGLSVGAGINLIYAEGRLSRYQDLSAVAGQAALALDEPYSDIEGDDIAATFRFGVLYELSGMTQIGLSVQTGTDLDLDGDATISDFPVLSSPGQTTTLTEKVRVPLAIPGSATLGLRHRFNDSFTLLAGATYARWSRFEELDIYSREGQSGQVSQAIGRQSGQPITHITEKWRDTWQLNLGGIWQVTPDWALKAGYAWDESPVNKQYVTARIPSQDRHWLTLGAQWKDNASGWTVDAAMGTLLFSGDAKVNDREYGHDNPTQPATPANYQGTYDLSAWSAALQVSKAF
jgi:long-chain fatty acid transport protein